MSTRRTLLLTNCCHIYTDYLYDNDGNYDCDLEVMVIDVSYEDVGDFNSIEVLLNSDFAALVLFMLKHHSSEELEKVCRDNWLKNSKE